MNESVDRPIRELYEREPLFAFSLYSASQVKDLALVRQDLIEMLPKKDVDGTMAWTDSKRYFAYFWLWVLGAYEVLRTMDENGHCFSESARQKIAEMKRKVAVLRIPFAKQQLRGEKKGKTKFHAEISAVGHTNGLTYEVSGERFNSETLMEEVMVVLQSIKLDDIVQSL